MALIEISLAASTGSPVVTCPGNRALNHRAISYGKQYEVIYEVIHEGIHVVTPGQTVIFEDEDEGPEMPGRSLVCPDYRKLAWRGGFPVSINNESTTNPSPPAEVYRRRRNRSLYTNRPSTSAATQQNISRIQTSDYYRINLVSPVIIATGSTAWKHANDLKVKLGSHCLFFNHPEYFQAAAKILSLEYQRNCEQEAKVREDNEKTRSLLENVRAPKVGQRPSFCPASKDAYKPSVWVPRAHPLSPREDNEHPVGPTSHPHTLDAGALLNARPWDMDDLDLEAMDSEELGKNTSVQETYERAQMLLVNHFASMDHQIRLPLVPIVTPATSKVE